MIQSKVGPPVTGDDFFDRESEQRRIWEYLRGDDLLLLAPRRVGKTSLMFRLRDTASDHGVEAAYLSVAGASDEVGFVRKLFEANETMAALVENEEHALFDRVPSAEKSDHHTLRAAMILMDHNGYHAGQLVALRVALGVWPAG